MVPRNNRRTFPGGSACAPNDLELESERPVLPASLAVYCPPYSKCSEPLRRGQQEVPEVLGGGARSGAEDPRSLPNPLQWRHALHPSRHPGKKENEVRP